MFYPSPPIYDLGIVVPLLDATSAGRRFHGSRAALVPDDFIPVFRYVCPWTPFYHSPNYLFWGSKNPCKDLLCAQGELSHFLEMGAEKAKTVVGCSPLGSDDFSPITLIPGSEMDTAHLY